MHLIPRTFYRINESYIRVHNDQFDEGPKGMKLNCNYMSVMSKFNAGISLLSIHNTALCRINITNIKKMFCHAATIQSIPPCTLKPPFDFAATPIDIHHLEGILTKKCEFNTIGVGGLYWAVFHLLISIIKLQFNFRPLSNWSIYFVRFNHVTLVDFKALIHLDTQQVDKEQTIIMLTWLMTLKAT